MCADVAAFHDDSATRADLLLHSRTSQARTGRKKTLTRDAASVTRGFRIWPVTSSPSRQDEIFFSGIEADFVFVGELFKSFGVV